MLAANIEDQPHNVTRFAVIAERSEERTGRDKTTLMLRLPNQAGALRQGDRPVREERRQHDLDRVVPRPPTGRRDRDPTYLFFLDIDGHADDEPVKKTLDQVRKRCERLEILGSYPRGECIES